MFKFILVVTAIGAASAVPSISDALKSSSDFLKLYRSFKEKIGNGSGKTSLAETAKRLQLFRKSLKMIQEINSKNLGWKADLTIFADRSFAEFSKYGGVNMTGVLVEKVERQAKSLDLPLNVDWRQEGAVSSIKNQGRSNACWTYSAVVVLEALYKKASGRLVEFSDQELMDCVYEGTDHSGSYGGWPQVAMKYLVDKGRIAYKSDYKSTGTDGKCMSNDYHNAIFGYKAYDIRHIAKDDAGAVAEIAKSPIGVVFQMTSYSSLYSGGIYYDTQCGDWYGGLHAAPAVGYTPSAFIIKNSYGTNWGQQGYLLWKRGWSGCRIFEFNYSFSLKEEEEK